MAGVARRSGWGWLRGLGIAAAISLGMAGCAKRLPPLPDEVAPSYVTLETLRRTEEMSLYPERLDRRFLVGALDALEARFDSVRFEDHGASGILRVGNALAQVPLAPRLDLTLYLQTLSRAVKFVDRHLEDEREPDDDLELIALRGGLFAIDRYATIFSGRSTEDFKIRFSGHLKGIGSTIGRKDGVLEAVKVFPDSPAQRGGLENGDLILTIDGEPTQPLSVSDAVDRIRGEANTVVVLGVRRKEEELSLRITRGDVVIPSVEAKGLENGIGYAKIDQVSRATGGEFQSKVGGLGELRGLVLDLRGNSGGAMSGAQQLASFFLDSQLIVRVVARGGVEPPGGDSRLFADPGVQFKVPVVVLVDPLTASAAEILSGALEPLDQVTLLGQRTYGKGVIQQVLPLPQENLLKLTVAQYLLSADRVVDQVGIAPDIQLTPVSPEQLGALASVPEGSIAYLLSEEGETEPAEDAFPVEAAGLLLRHGQTRGIERIRRRSSRRIAAALAEFGVNWRDPGSAIPRVLPEALRITATQTPLAAHRGGSLRVEVHNPNPFPLPDAWIAIEGTRLQFPDPHGLERKDRPENPPPPKYLANKLVSLGEIPAGGTASGTLELTVPDGMAALEHPIRVSVASGSRPLQGERFILEVSPLAPKVQLDVARRGQRVTIDVHNTGERAIAEVSVDVEGAQNLLKDIAPGDSQRAELQLSGDAKEIVATFSGPFARRRISMPIPDAELHVDPPRIEISHDRERGTTSARVEAAKGTDLHEGWLVLDDQKAAYAAWGGTRTGVLTAPFDVGIDHRLAVKVEDRAGVSVIEALELCATSPHTAN